MKSAYGIPLAYLPDGAYRLLTVLPFAAMGQGPLGVYLEKQAAGPVIATLKVLEKLHLSPVYEWAYETAAVDSYVSIDKAERMLGFRPMGPLSLTLHAPGTVPVVDVPRALAHDARHLAWRVARPAGN